jgi:hypothetical protein
LYYSLHENGIGKYDENGKAACDAAIFLNPPVAKLEHSNAVTNTTRDQVTILTF